MVAAEVGEVVAAAGPRVLPALTEVNRGFWTGGGSGRLLVQRCADCRRWTHPPVSSRCPACDGKLMPEAVSGRGEVFSYTVNEHPFHPQVPVPHVIGVVQLDEQEDLRLPASIVGVEPNAVDIGLRVVVAFEAHGEVHVPVFQPEDPGRRPAR